MPTAEPSRVSVVVLAYGPEPELRCCVAAILADPDLELVLVDNGAAEAVAALPRDPRMTVLRPGQNTGFAGGVNLAAGVASGQVLVLVNSDAIVAPGAIAVLAGALADPAVGVVSGGVRLADTPELMNTAGNPVTYLGVAWAGGLGEPHEKHAEQVDVASASGCFLAVRRDVWDELGGFDDSYFAYHEDTDLSLRAWLLGYRVQVVPAAVAAHHYAFSRNPGKLVLVERNRWQTVLTTFPTRVLLGALPALLGFEVAVLALAVRQGWLVDKLRTYVWLLRHRSELRRRRREVQASARITDAAFARLLSSNLETPASERPPGLALLNVVLGGYWAAWTRAARLR